MNEYRAITRYVRMSPRKARLAAGLIRGLPVEEAVLQLQYCGMKAGRVILKTLQSAVANAIHEASCSQASLVVQEVRVDEGPRLKRAKPRSRGNRHPIVHKLSHVTVVVSE